MLAYHFLQKYAARSASQVKKISPEAMRLLSAHHWQGNVRELENAVEHAVILAKHDKVDPEDLPFDLRNGHDHSGAQPELGELVSLKKVEETHVRRVLERTSSVAEAARVLGIDDATIYRKRKKIALG